MPFGNGLRPFVNAQNVSRGFAALGLFMGLWFTLITSVIYLLAGAIEASDGQDIALVTATAVYLEGGLIGGALVGIFHSLGRWKWGQAVLGMAGMAPGYVLMGKVYYGTQYGSFESVSGTIVMSVLTGGALGLLVGQEFGNHSRDNAQATDG